ncbi:hypothetical protein M2175_004314 [Bradyrhizobium elkanii]|jgi:hypothetical protein|uniref:hypothetical protein n=1 Tax=Bradyrhizobium TaxID=374 RepID=UPI0004B6322F|nr:MULTISPECIES: hypothetical protein [Bradyrhizobium]MCS3929283.1 hypothetical protein [Bradyrhizobium elkanii]MCS3969839.1 hypothetical protein [Bradyrhizobium japonicum]
MRLWLSIIAICFAGPALAGQAGVMTLGVGQRSCGQFIAAVGQAPLGATVQRKSQDGGRFYAELIRYHEWIMGFVTGYNSAYEENTDTQIRDDISALDLWMRKWCNDHPTKMFVEGAQAFRDENAPKR